MNADSTSLDSILETMLVKTQDKQLCIVIHLIPRRRGDVEEPRGGVRGVIAEKQNY